MVIDNADLANLAGLAVRALQHQVRQTVSSSLATSATSSLASATSSVFATPTSASDVPPAATTDANTGNNNNGGNNGGGGGGSSPLLFFVALGFGVVFTNLWIIVGVKYCFRYNARNRNLRMTGEDGEPINLENMPQHPRRRRREKKLMTIDEVNEKFPMMKYKSWVASRAQEGLPTRGGISQPPSRAGSIRDADGIIPVDKEEVDNAEDRPATSGASVTRSPTHDEPTTEHAEKLDDSATVDAKPEQKSTDAAPGGTVTTASPDRTDSPGTDEDENDEEDDQIHDALPPELLEAPGDTCAICIDTLEDDDDVRGLSCGHAFHAVCLDPWLTSRRACCPLCKADYYTPKPRPPPADGAQGAEVGPTVSINPDPRTNRANMPARPGVIWVFHPRRGRFALPSMNRNARNNRSNQAATATQTSTRRTHSGGLISRAAAASGTSRTPAQAPAASENQSSGFLSGFRLPRFNLPGRSNANTDVTPSNLEAGTRTEAAR